MKLFGLYTLDDIPNLKENHARFAKLNSWEYRSFSIHNSYEKWVLVYRLLESHPGETLAFIDAFSYFVTMAFAEPIGEDMLIQEANGKVMDNFFFVRSCLETKRLFFDVQSQAAGRYVVQGSLRFELSLPNGIAKPYAHQISPHLYFNVDVGFLSNALDLDNILVAKHGGDDAYTWGSYCWTAAEILCTRPRLPKEQLSATTEFQLINPGKPRALLALSSPEPGKPPPDYAAVSERNFRTYAEQQNVTLYLYKAIPEELKGLHSTWTKPYLVLRHLPEHQYLSWVDADILISRNFQLPEGEDVIVYNDPGTWMFNAGFMTFRNSAKTMEFLQAVITRCESIDDRSSLYVNGSDQTQFIEEFRLHFPDSLPRSNLVANIPVSFDALREPGPGLWHFMGLNPPSVRALVMDYYDKNIVNMA